MAYQRPRVRIIAGLKCSGKKEEFYIRSLAESSQEIPKKARCQRTPIGRYTPDFEFEDKFIEIKSPGTFDVMLGRDSFIRGGKVSDLQWRKIQWVALNVRPVEILVMCKSPDHVLDIPEAENITIKKIYQE